MAKLSCTAPTVFQLVSGQPRVINEVAVRAVRLNFAMMIDPWKFWQLVKTETPPKVRELFRAIF